MAYPHRKNVTIACQVCRSRKRKCDGVFPSCSLCVSNDRQCVYEIDGRTTKKRKQYDDQHIRELEDQVLVLKQCIQDLKEGGLESGKEMIAQEASLVLGQGRGESGGVSSKDTKEEAQGSAQEVHQDEDSRHVDATQDLSQLFWALDISDTGETQFRGPSGNFCFPTSDAPRLQSRNESNILNDGDVYLMQTYHHLHLDLFMRHVNPFHLFLDDTLPLQNMVDPTTYLPIQLLCAPVISAGAMYSTDNSAKTAAETIKAFAESLVLNCCREYPSTTVLRAVSILSWIELGLNNDNMGWMYNHMAISLVSHLGLHVIALPELRTTEPVSQLMRNSRIEAFWPVFLQDRMATSLLERNCALPWGRVRVPFVDTRYPESLISDERRVFSLQCRLWDLHDRYMDQIYCFEFTRLKSIQRHSLLLKAREALSCYRTTWLDPAMSRPEGATAQDLLLQLSFHMSLTLIHRPFLRPCEDQHSSQLARRTITAAADASTVIIKRLVTSAETSRLPYTVVHHVLTTALSHLLSITSGDNKYRHKSVNGLRLSLKALEILGRTWQSRASHAILTVQRLAARWRVVSALPIHLSHPVTSSEGLANAPPLVPTSSSTTACVGEMSSSGPMFEFLDPLWFQSSAIEEDWVQRDMDGTDRLDDSSFDSF